MVTSQQCIDKYGEPDVFFERKWMTLWRVPNDIGNGILALPKKIYVNKDFQPILEKALRSISKKGAGKDITTWDGCFNVRMSKGNHTEYSLHSWGIAVDINAAWNQYAMKPSMSLNIVASFIGAGCDWGGYWHTPDGMHFQISKI